MKREGCDERASTEPNFSKDFELEFARRRVLLVAVDWLEGPSTAGGGRA